MVKVLIISASFNAGDAITMMNLFSGWNKCDLFLASPCKTKFVDYFMSFYYLGEKECRPFFLFRPWVKFSKSGVIYSRINDAVKYDKEITLYRFLNRVYKKFAFPLLQYFGLYNRRYSLYVSTEFSRWVNGIRPDIIYSPVSNEAIMKFLIQCQKEFLSVKYVFHGFDDWCRPAYKVMFKTHYVHRLDNLYRVLISKSDLLLSTTEMMSKDFRYRYGKDFITFHNPVDISVSNNMTVSFDDEKYHIVYVGKIAWHNAEAIRNMNDALSIYNAHETKKIVLDIYTPSKMEILDYFKVKSNDNIILHHAIPNSEIIPLLRGADILFLPITISKEVALFAKYSMSTKMGEYLFSETPIIYCGPREIAMTAFVEEQKVAFYTTENGPQPLLNLIRQCLCNRDYALQLAEKGKEVAISLFNKNEISIKFYRLLSMMGNSKNLLRP